jgi:rhodanese-related sulfurtransferase
MRARKSSLGFAKETAILAGLALLFAAVSNLTARPERRLDWIGRSSPVPKAPAPATPAATAAAPSDFPPHPDKPFLEISPEQAKVLFDRGALFADARRTEVFREGHVRGARSFSVWEADLDGKLLALSQEGRDLTQPIVAYCSGGDCEDSHQLAERLWSIGFNNVLVYRDGFPDWEKRGWPIEREAKK